MSTEMLALKRGRPPQTLKHPAAHGPEELDPKRSRVQVGGEEKEFEQEFVRHGVLEVGQSRLLPLLQQWGKTRAAQIFGLWTFLGDGVQRPVATSTLQVWGPPGTGKTELLNHFVKLTGLNTVKLDCACHALHGELEAQLVEGLRQIVEPTVTHPSYGTRIRAIDRLETAINPLLERFAVMCASEMSAKDVSGSGIGAENEKHVGRKSKTVKPINDEPDPKVVLILDNVQELARSNMKRVEFFLSLPELLRNGTYLSVSL